jgi:UDP-N-acetylmuramoylalanine--D-glutamate ligase
MQQLIDTKITILGAARSGLAVARLLHKAGARVFVSDQASIEAKSQEAAELHQAGIDFEFGGHSMKAYDTQMVVLSPGIPLRSEVVRPFLEKNIAVLSEVEIAYWFCKAPIIAVTGSNGKTTTTTLIGEMLRKKYSDAIVAGNIGQAFSEFVEQSNERSWAVVELSSFQLETIDTFHPRQAVVLNFAPNHLNRYDSYEDYLRAKWRITKNISAQDHLIYNAADPVLADWAGKIDCQKQGFHFNGEQSHAAYCINDALFINYEKFIETKEIILRGKHNYMNAMAAILAASNAGVSHSHIKEVLTTFKGVEHRLEEVAVKDGIAFINDSKATTVESLSFALQSFENPVILIAGGQDKGSDFTTVNAVIGAHVKIIILIGSAASKMEQAWQGLKPIYREASLQDAVIRARSLAREKDVVLLSPACASFDMFTDFEDRGRQFKNIVESL